MPEKIIKKFKKEYGNDKGENIFYATAKKQHRNPKTFSKLKEIVRGVIKELPDETDMSNPDEKEEVRIGKAINKLIDIVYVKADKGVDFEIELNKIKEDADKLIKMHGQSIAESNLNENSFYMELVGEIKSLVSTFEKSREFFKSKSKAGNDFEAGIAAGFKLAIKEINEKILGNI